MKRGEGRILPLLHDEKTEVHKNDRLSCLRQTMRPYRGCFL